MIASAINTISTSANVSLSFGTWNIGQGLSNKLLRILNECIDMKLNIIGLQETGEAELDPALIGAAGYRAYSCPASHSGVAILIAKPYCKYIRGVKRGEEDGRLISMELDINGERIIIINAYLPSGIDFKSDSGVEKDRRERDKKLIIAEQVHEMITEWSRDTNKKAIVLGDMNETFTAFDRSRNTSAMKHARFISQLTTNGFIDVYRSLHPTDPGFTHATTSSATGYQTESRLDYIFMRGWKRETIQQCSIHTRSSLSHHNLLYMRMEVTIEIETQYKKVKLSVPNLRKATDEMKHELVEAVEVEWNEMSEWINKQLATNTRKGIDLLANRLSSTVYTAACSILGMTGQKKWKHSGLDKVKQQRKQLIALRSLAKQIHVGDSSRCDINFNSYEWKHKLKQCQRSLEDTGPIPNPVWDYTDFDTQCKQLLTTVSRNINRIKLQIAAESKSKIDYNPTAAVHRMMRTSTEHQLDNVVTEDGQLITNPESMKQLLYNGFASVFDFNLPRPLTEADAIDATLVTTTAKAKAKAAATPPPSCPDWYNEVYLKRRKEIKAEWYDGLMDTVSADEVREVCASCPYYVAPGHDGVNAGVWRVLAEGSRSICDVLASLFSSCLKLGIMPVLGKKSIIVPIPKKQSQPMKMNNIRPISLQAALTKLISKLLATRLANILAAHPILHAAQEAFIKNGAISNCVDSWLDIWEMSKENKRNCFNLFYDIKAAYDSVQHMDLLRALYRLHLPHSFVVLIADSLTNLTSSVRTIYGLTNEFQVRRSVRQGDPLAPLLYVIFMDALHAGMECNPVAEHKNKRDGFVFKSAGGISKSSSCSSSNSSGTEIQGVEAVAVASKGFADDTVAMSSTLIGLSRINDWVHAWISFNHLQLHPDKTKLVGRYKNKCMSNDEIQLSVAGKVLTPAPLTESITYLGVTTNMEMQWNGTVKKVNRLIGLFTCRIKAYKLTVPQAIMVINIYLIPKLDLSLRYVNVSDWQLKRWDQMLSRCINVCAGMKRHIGAYAISVLTGLMLASQYESIAKISECFLRLNNNSLSSTTGQMRWKQMEGSTASTASYALNNRLVRIRKLVAEMRWELKRVPEMRGGADRKHGNKVRKKQTEGGGEWKYDELVPSVVKRVDLFLNENKYSLVYDYIGEWGIKFPKEDVIVYTDGSSSNVSNADTDSGSSWGICFADDWLQQNYRSLPIEEQHITMQQHLIHACVAGGRIDVTISSGIFMAELQAIYRALQAIPVTYNLTIISDSQAAIKAVHTYRQAVSNRKRMRMIGRPLLHLIVKLIYAHEKRGSRVIMKHIKSHTSATTTHTRTQHQAGNSCADRVAAFCRTASEHQIASMSTTVGASVCLTAKQVDMKQGENFLYAEQEMQLVTADIRKSLSEQAKTLAIQFWQQESTHPAYAGKEVLDLCKQILEDGTDRKRIRFVLSLVTDSAQYYRYKNKEEKKTEVLEYKCNRCDTGEIANVEHVLSCDGYKQERERVTMKLKMQLRELKRVQEWLLIDGADLELCSLLCRLFFDVPMSDLKPRTRVRLMFGGFSDREFAAALKRVQATENKEKWLPVVVEMRRLLFEHVYSLSLVLR